MPQRETRRWGSAPGPRLSDEMRLVARPLGAYRDLVLQPVRGRWSVALRRPIKWLMIAVCVLSFTAAGRLVWFHLLFAPLVWWLVVAAQGLPRRRSRR